MSESCAIRPVSALLEAYRGVRPATCPVWFMRQAGRSLPEYRKAREGIAMLDACLMPELVAELTVQPVRRHGVDAAIFFSDIVVPLKLAGIAVDIVPGKGPVFAHPIRRRSDVEALVSRSLDGFEDALAPISSAVALTCEALDEIHGEPLIGFAGAPFTLATYLVEGGPSKDHLRTRAFMHADPQAWQQLMAWLAELVSRSLEVQIRAGVAAVQLFDSWAGAVSAADYTTYVAPATHEVFEKIAHGDSTHREVPRVLFGVGTQHLLPAMGRTGATVIGIDYRTPLDVANAALGGGLPLQGNIDPALLSAPWEVLRQHVDNVLTLGEAAPAHIVNLGHGVPADTDPDVLTRLVEYVHGAQA